MAKVELNQRLEIHKALFRKEGFWNPGLYSRLVRSPPNSVVAWQREQALPNLLSHRYHFLNDALSPLDPSSART